MRGRRWRSLLLSTACAGQLRVSLCAGRKQAPGRARQSPRTSTTSHGSGGTSGQRTRRSGTPDAEFRSCTLGCPPDTSQDRVDGRCDKTLAGPAPPTRNVCDATSTRSYVRIIPLSVGKLGRMTSRLERAEALVTNAPMLKADAHPAATYFAEQLQSLMSQHRVRMPGGKTRRLTPLGLQRMLAEKYPGKLSQSQMYRLHRGEALPYVDDICMFADFFGVSPRVFVAD